MKLDDATLDKRLAALTRHAQVDEVSWQAIEARLKRRRRLWPAGIASGIGMAAALALAILVVGPPETAPRSFGAMIIAAEVQAMRQQAGGMSLPETDRINGTLALAWADNERAIDELEAALAQHPEDSVLMDFLAQARLRQSELINQATTGGVLAYQWSL